MFLNLITITPEDTSLVWAYAGEMIDDFSPLLMIFMSVAVGLLVVVGIINVIKK